MKRQYFLIVAISLFVAADRAGAGTNSALDFAPKTPQGTTEDSYVSVTNSAKLGLSTFTIEARFIMQPNSSPAFVTTDSYAIPLVTKGRGECDGCPADVNYVLGIQGNVLFADFEEGAGGTSPGLNHPITGVTPIQNGVWYHAAATYDGTKWQLFLNGVLESELIVAQPPKSDSIQPFAIGTALDSTGAPDGYFSGAVDEVRVWNYARTQQQIQAAMNTEITAEAGLVARWGMNEGTGTDVADSTAGPANGSIIGDNYSWVNQPPDVPVLNGPPAGATDMSRPAILDVGVADLDTTSLTVTYYGRLKPAASPLDFTIVALPDTQYYASALNGGSPAMFNSQTHWAVDNLSTENIAYVVQLGDCVEHGDNDGNTIEWDNAWTALSALEDPSTTLLPFGIPYGVSVGNHDQSPEGDVTGTTALYNAYFGVSHFSGKSYYGGHYGTNNNNWYDLFSASGMNFIVVSMEYDTIGNSAVLQWANDLLQTYSDRRAIVVSHYITDSSGDISKGLNSSFGQQGRTIYNSLRGNPNLFLMLCGHIVVGGEGQRVDVFNGHTVYSLLSNYQSREGGGNGWLRTLHFSPQHNQLSVQTYSPWLSQFENDADSSFTLTYNMQDDANSGFSIIATNADVPSGTSSAIAWNNLLPNTAYEWYVTVSDGKSTIVSPVWQFTTAAVATPPLNSVVSRKVHGDAGIFDLALNPGTPATIEPRAGGTPSGNHTLVFSFRNTLNAVTSITATAATSNGTQNVTADGSIGTGTHQNEYTVNLTGVPNASHLNVTLNGVIDSATNVGNISADMDVLIGDVNASRRTDAGDVTAVRNNTVTIPDQSTCRFDVNASGRIDAGDVTATRNATVTVLP
jgi:hypothetical protein